MKLYKITDENGQTQNDTQWGENVTHKAKVKGNTLCTYEVIHAYRDPYLAVFHNPIGGDYPNTMLMWEAKGRVCADDGMKVGCKSLTTTKQIPLPVITTEQRVEITIRCAVKVCKDTSFIKWANEWLDGTDRTAEAAEVARAARAATRAATRAAEAAAWAAAGAAEAAAWAAWAARAATRAAEAAAGAAEVVKDIDIIKIIHEVIDTRNMEV